jgi:pyrophosphatase PpaX
MPILFDLDGTLVDTIDLLLQSMRHAFADFSGRRPSAEEWVAGIGTPLATQFRAFARDEEEVERLITRYRGFQQIHHDRLTRCYPGVVEVVRALAEAGQPLAVVTSKADDMARRTLAHVGLASYFSVVVGVQSTTRHKPDPEPVRFALAQLGASAEGTFFVGDSPHDIVSGNAAGVATVAALWGPFRREVLEQARPTYVIDRIGALAMVLDGSRSREPNRA